MQTFAKLRYILTVHKNYHGLLILKTLIHASYLLLTSMKRFMFSYAYVSQVFDILPCRHIRNKNIQACMYVRN